MTPRSPPPIWSQNGTILRGYQNGADVDGGLTFPVSFPGVITKPQIVNLASSALANGTFDILDNVRFYLTGDADDIELVQKTWPNLGFAYNPPRPELNGGFRSFDGINWTTFAIRDPTLTGSVGAGDQNDPTTWILLPGSAMGGNGQDGTLGPGLFLAATYICSRARARPPRPVPCRRRGQELSACSCRLTVFADPCSQPVADTRGEQQPRQRPSGCRLLNVLSNVLPMRSGSVSSLSRTQAEQ